MSTGCISTLVSPPGARRGLCLLYLELAITQGHSSSYLTICISYWFHFTSTLFRTRVYVALLFVLTHSQCLAQVSKLRWDTSGRSSSHPRLGPSLTEHPQCHLGHVTSSPPVSWVTRSGALLMTHLSVYGWRSSSCRQLTGCAFQWLQCY